MESTRNFGEEIREYLHPILKDLKVSIAMPDSLALSQIADRLAKVQDTAEGIKIGEEVLTEILRGVSSNVQKNGQEPTLKEWAHELFAARYEFRRSAPIAIVIQGEVAKDPVSLLPLEKGQYRTWQDPRTCRMYVVLWDPEKDEPVHKLQRVAFGNHLIESVLFNASEDDPGKSSPTLSAAQ